MAVHPRTIARLQARILERAAYCIEFELSDPRASFITLTGVELARDLSTAKISYSVLGTQADRSKVAHMLESATGFIQRQVARVLRTRRMPRLVWVYDDSVEYAAEMDRKIREALRKDRDVNPAAHDEMALADPDDPEDLTDSEYGEFLDAQDGDDSLT